MKKKLISVWLGKQMDDGKKFVLGELNRDV